jgi:hypothetical protein
VWLLTGKISLQLDFISSPLTKFSNASCGTGFLRMRWGDTDADPGRETESAGERDAAVYGLDTVEEGISGRGGMENAKGDLARSFSNTDC